MIKKRFIYKNKKRLLINVHTTRKQVQFFYKFIIKKFTFLNGNYSLLKKKINLFRIKLNLNILIGFFISEKISSKNIFKIINLLFL